MKIDWAQKLSSRKFWCCIIAVVTDLLVIFGVDNVTIEQITGLIGANAALIAYIFSEGFVDANRSSTKDDDSVKDEYPIPLVYPNNEED